MVSGAERARHTAGTHAVVPQEKKLWTWMLQIHSCYGSQTHRNQQQALGCLVLQAFSWQAGIDVVPETVRTWNKELGMTRRRRYIKPKLTIRHKIDRLSFVLDQIDPTTSNFNNWENVVHGDEKWFFMMKDGTVCRVFPDKRGEYKVPAPPRVFHKWRMPKIMFLAVCARPRPEYNFDGKI